MKEPNWEEAPEGATHYLPSSDLCRKAWVKVDGADAWYCYDDTNEWRPWFGWKIYRNLFIERHSEHAAWTGDGLPPVGTVCEIAASTQYLTIRYQEGMKVKVYANFTDDRGVELAAWVSDKAEEAGVCTAKCFRPIRTPEQIAAEEREQAIDMMLIVLRCGKQGNWDIDRHTCEVFYDAGLRFPEGGAQ